MTRSRAPRPSTPTNPAIAPRVMVPPVTSATTNPPTMVTGRVRNPRVARRQLPNAAWKRRKIPTSTATATTRTARIGYLLLGEPTEQLCMVLERELDVAESGVDVGEPLRPGPVPTPGRSHQDTSPPTRVVSRWGSM